jgi:hypothetical protein
VFIVSTTQAYQQPFPVAVIPANQYLPFGRKSPLIFHSQFNVIKIPILAGVRHSVRYKIVFFIDLEEFCQKLDFWNSHWKTVSLIRLLFILT